jgi:hypothetical protein
MIRLIFSRVANSGGGAVNGFGPTTVSPLQSLRTDAKDEGRKGKDEFAPPFVLPSSTFVLRIATGLEKTTFESLRRPLFRRRLALAVIANPRLSSGCGNPVVRSGTSIGHGSWLQGLATSRARALLPARRSPRRSHGPAIGPWIGTRRVYLCLLGDCHRSGKATFAMTADSRSNACRKREPERGIKFGQAPQAPLEFAVLEKTFARRSITQRNAPYLTSARLLCYGREASRTSWPPFQSVVAGSLPTPLVNNRAP